MIRTNNEINPELARSEVFENRDYLVVPVVMIVEGVLNGAYLPAEELEKSAPAWNGRPVPVLHPKDADQYVSANSPDVIERCVIGQVFSTHVEDGKLKAELWIDIAKAEALGFGDYLNCLRSGEVTEVSTGYFADEDTTSGTFNEKEYSVIHRNLRPDHLALLPNETGACSVEDGCGAPRVNQQSEGNDMPRKKEDKPCKPCEDLQALHTNGKLDADQYETLKGFGEQLGIENFEALVAIIEALMPAETEEPEAEADADAEVDIEAQVEQLARRLDATRRFKANALVELSDEELKITPVAVLEKLIKADEEQVLINYEGKAGFDNSPVKRVDPLLPVAGLIKRK